MSQKNIKLMQIHPADFTVAPACRTLWQLQEEVLREFAKLRGADENEFPLRQDSGFHRQRGWRYLAMPPEWKKFGMMQQCLDKHFERLRIGITKRRFVEADTESGTDEVEITLWP